MFSLEKKTAIITGGGSGIGKAIATLFATQGATVHIIDLGENGKAASAEINSGSGRSFSHACDVSKQEEVKKTIEVIAQNSTIDILVNNAGVAHIGNAENTSEQDLDRLYNINIKGVYNCIHSVLPVMKKTGGVILNMASIASLSGIPDRFAYSMTKGAVVGMTLSTAKDYINHKIRCNCISPARVHTPFVDGFLSKNYPGREKEMFEKLSRGQPIGRMAQPEEVAYLALYLCSDEASFITGCDYPFDGGFTKLNN